MDDSLSFAAWFWLLVPMLSVVVLSVITYFTEKKKQDRGSNRR